MSNVTVVSGLFYLAREKWKYSAFPNDHDRYKIWVKNLLSLKVNLYFYVDDFYYDYVLEHRLKYDPELKNTVIIKMNLSDTETYKNYYVREACLMNSPEFRSSKLYPETADMSYPLYHIVNFTKIEFIKRAFEDNKFNSNYFFWVDAGALREDIHLYENTQWLDESSEVFNDKVTHFSHNSEFTITDKRQYFLSQIRNIQGTAWIVPKTKVISFFNKINVQIQTILDEQIVGSDEKIYDFLYLENPDFYQLVKCGWFEFYEKCKKQNKKIFIDMGTHECQGLWHFKNLLNIDKSWEVHTFEPNPLISESCIYNFSDLNIVRYATAVWVDSTTQTFKLFGDTGHSQGSYVGSLGDKGYHDYYSEVSVECIDVFEFLKKFDEEDELYIKMDIEWSEYKIIPYLIQKGWPKNIKQLWVEWHGMNRDEYIKLAEELKYHLQKNTSTSINNWI